MNRSSAEKFQSSIATYWFDQEGILHIMTKSTRRTMQNAMESFELIKKITNAQKVCVIIDTTKSDMADKETRNFITSKFPDYFKAIAFVSGSATGEIVSSLFFVEQPTLIIQQQSARLPMKACSNEKEAKEWLRQYL